MIAADPVADRVDLVGADMLSDGMPGGYDIVLAAHVVHWFPPEGNRTLLAQLRESVVPGGRLLLVDWWLDPEDPHPYAVLGAGEFLLGNGGGTYQVAEVDPWLRQAGWRIIDEQPLPPPMGLGGCGGGLI